MELAEARIAVLAENQYQELELWYPVLRFREAGSDVIVIAPKGGQLYSSKLGLPVVSDMNLAELEPADVDALVIPGGFAPEAMRKSAELLDLVRKTFDGGGIVAAICHAGWVLASAGIASGHQVTCVPVIRDDVIHAGGQYIDQPVVRDGNLITSRLPNDLPLFCAEIIDALHSVPGHRGSGASWPDRAGRLSSAAYSVPAELVMAPGEPRDGELHDDFCCGVLIGRTLVAPSSARDGNVESLPLSRITQDGATDAVRRQLIQMIESEHLAVGDRLPAEAELAKAFGVSRPVVREALVSLRILGLTSSRSGSGTFVASSRIRMPLSFDGSTSDQLNEVRSHLEVPCAGLAAKRRTQKQLDELGRIVEEFEAEADPGRRVRIDSRFHVAVAQATGNPLFGRLVEDLRGAVEEQALAVSLAPGRRQEASDEHRRIFESIRAGDAGLAEKLMVNHLEHLGHSIAVLAEPHAVAAEPEKKATVSARRRRNGRSDRQREGEP